MTVLLDEHAAGSRSDWWRRLSPAVRVALLAALAAGVILAAFLFGQHNPRIVQEDVHCLSAEGAISCELADGWTIGIPQDVRWLDVNGVSHEGGRPDCLPPSGIGLQGPVRVAWTTVEVDGSGWRQVLFVSCQS